MARKMLKPTPTDQDVWTASLDRVRHLYEMYDDVLVSFSGGKDSTATLHVTLEVAHELDRLPVRVLFFDEEAIPYETEQYVRRVSERDDVDLEWYCLPMKQRNSCATGSPWWSNWGPEDEDLWVRDLPAEAITQHDGLPVGAVEDRWTIAEAAGLFIDPTKRTVVLLGIRAAESLIRQRAVVSRTEDNYIVSYQRGDTPSLPPGLQLDKAYPIYDWSTPDVWTAPRKFDWDYNEAYDLMEMAGIAAHSQRCAPPYAEEPMQALWMFAVCFPDIWDRVSERVPGASTAARYARTELYSFGKTPPKPSHLSWEEHLLALCTGHEAADAVAGTVAGIKKLMVRHYRLTTDPILPTVKHPDSGVSWNFLATCAARGNLKARRQAHLYGGEAYVQQRALYNAARSEIETQLGYPLTADNCGKVT